MDMNIAGFAEYLREQEKSGNTAEKYVRDVNAFRAWSVQSVY